MNLKFVTFLVFIALFELAYSSEECFNLIKMLSNQDKCLGSRINLKRNTAKFTTNPDDFFNQMLNVPCNGTEYSCGNTRSWVSEVFLGLKSQFQNSKLDIDGVNGEMAGYSLFIGKPLVDLFELGRLRNESIIYQLRHIGTEDHDWTIEQLANQAGFRIYQSYNDAFSNKAWLSTSLDGLFDNKDILSNQKAKNLANTIIMQMTSGKFNLSNFESSTEIPASLRPFARYVRDYNQTMAEANFQRGWNKYGKGQILSWDVMKNYINILANMTSYLNANANTANLFDEKIFNDWIDLFSAPDLIHFPNLPNNFITSVTMKDRVYRFEVKVSLLTEPSNCAYNADIVNARYSPIKNFFCYVLRWC